MNLFASVEQFLMKFFAGAQAGENDFHIPPRARAGQPDHLFGEVEDPHRLAHVQDTNGAAIDSRIVEDGGLKDQFNRFANGHEIARHRRGGDG